MTDHSATPPAAAPPATSLPAVTTTTVVHRRTKNPAWWHEAVVYQVPGVVDVDALDVLSDEISNVARLGADALLLHAPEVGADRAAEPVDRLVHRAHRRGIRVLAAVGGTDAPAATADPTAWHRERCAWWLARGVDGIDLRTATAVASGPHQHAGVDLGAVHALVADRPEEAVLTAAASAADPDSLAAHIEEDWLHVLRDDRLVSTPWHARSLRDAITRAYPHRDAVGAAAGWTLAVAEGGTAAGPLAPAWADLAPDTRRARQAAVTLLMLALPGVAHIHLGDTVGLDTGGTTVQRLRAVSRAAAEQRGTPGSTFERYRQALRLRRELRLGSGPLAWMDDAPAAEALVLVNREVLVLVNLGAAPVRIPAHREILHASRDLPAPQDDAVLVPQDTTVWLSLA
ncbi:MAG: alpha-amylase family protein [Georgenia sp.]